MATNEQAAATSGAAIALHWLTAALIRRQSGSGVIDGPVADQPAEAALVRLAQMDRNHRVPADLRCGSPGVGPARPTARADARVAAAGRSADAPAALRAAAGDTGVRAGSTARPPACRSFYLGLVPLPDLVPNDKAPGGPAQGGARGVELRHVRTGLCAYAWPRSSTISWTGHRARADAPANRT